MKRFYLFVLFAFLFSLPIMAQNISVIDFYLAENDLTARTYGTKMEDQNGDLCAIIKVETTEKGLWAFDVGMLGVTDTKMQDSSHPAEIWVYVPHGISWISIQHDKLGKMDKYSFPYSIDKGCTYIMKLSTAKVNIVIEEQQKGQYLAFEITPPDAVLEVNGETWPLSPEGTASQFVNFGKYTYSVMAANYHSEAGAVTVSDPNKTQKVNVDLKPNFGWIEVTETNNLSGANVYIDNAFIGKVPCKSKELKSGQHKIRIVKELYETYTETVVVTDNQTTSLTPTLKANFAEVTLTVDADAEIWVNNIKKGVRTWTGPLANGTYRVECKQAGHENSSTTIEITANMKDHSISLPIPQAIYGSLSVKSSPDFAKLFIDGDAKGETPAHLSKILIGQHEVKLQKDGYDDYIERITVKRNETQTVNAILKKRTQPKQEEKPIAQNKLPQPKVPTDSDKQKIEQQTITNPISEYRDVNPVFIPQAQIDAIPTISHSLNDVLALMPQSVATSNGPALGGGNYRSSNLTIDGIPYNNAFGIGGNLPANGYPISLEALQNISIKATPYDVRYNNFTGASINAVTKKGTNQTHGAVYDYFTSSALIGTKWGETDEMGNYPDPLKISESLDNTIGINVSGPIVKDKLFYFINFEYQTDIDPGQSHYARQSEDDEWGGVTYYNRPTVARMEEISNYLLSTYNYNPGRYQNYKASTPDYNLLARLDWRIDENNELGIRYSLVKNKYSTAPSSSINPISSSVYNRNTYGRTSEYALYFESNRYYQEMNYSSISAKLCSKFAGGHGYNMFQASYSNQNEPRSFEGALFPTVDILEPLEDGTPAVYTSFGPDPFTYGNLRDVQTAVVTDEVSCLSGIHDFTFGGQFEWDNIKNGFMQDGAGYYIYNSWEDFVTNANPRAFAITYGNNENHEPVQPFFKYIQGSLYAQDEMTLSGRFKLSLGLRAELPYYPSIAGYNYNQEFAEGWDDAEGNHHAIADGELNTMFGLSTADMPQTRINLSPRLGFNWDRTSNRSFIIRGGSGFYSGRLPFVWIMSAVSNSNCLQNQYINSNEETQIKFFTTPNDIIANNSDLLLTGDLPAPQSTTIIDKNLLMPKVWKSNLAFDVKLPGDIKASLEGIYSYELTSVAVYKLGIIQDDFIQLPCEPRPRAHWRNEGIINSLGKAVTPYYISNGPEGGYYASASVQLSRLSKHGLNLLAAYTYSTGKNHSDGIGDQVTSAYNTNAFGVNGSNAHELGYSSYISPNRLLFYLGYNFDMGTRHSNTIGLYYEGRNLAYIGGYSYCRYSYTMTSNVNGDGGSNSLVYIPTEIQLLAEDSPYTNAEEFNTFIKADKYLSTHRGQYAERGGAVAPFFSTINFHFAHDFILKDDFKIQIGFDIKNLANIINRSWGNYQRLSSSDILKLTGNGTEDNPYQYTFTNPTWNVYASTYSTWSAAFNLHVSF